MVAINCRGIYADGEFTFAEVPTLIRHGLNGFLVDTPQEATAIFRALIDDPQLAREIGTEGAKAARSHFLAEVVGPYWEPLFKKLV